MVAPALVIALLETLEMVRDEGGVVTEEASFASVTAHPQAQTIKLKVSNKIRPRRRHLDMATAIRIIPPVQAHQLP
jgi:hypothetical protein